MKKILLLTFCFVNLGLYSQPAIIFDTDFGGDADDLGALAMLNHFVNRNECELLAIVVWSTEEYAVPAIDAVNTFYGNPDIPRCYSKPIADVFEHDLTYESAWEATLLYRKILSRSKDKDAIIVTTGPLKTLRTCSVLRLTASLR